MKLGFWNRLAFVAALLFSFGWATWMVVSSISQTAKGQQQGFSDCNKMVYFPNSDLTTEKCREIWLDQPNSFNFEYWLEAVGLLLVISAILYVIIWIAVWVVKWILRGRKTAR